MPYPKDFPMESAALVVSYLRGKSSASVGNVVEAVYDLVGFGLSKVLPSEDLPLIGELHKDVVQDVGEENLADVLETCMNSEQVEGAVGFAVPWTLVLPVLLRILDKLLHKYLDEQ